VAREPQHRHRHDDEERQHEHRHRRALAEVGAEDAALERQRRQDLRGVRGAPPVSR
jgi:hypothetical protein